MKFIFMLFVLSLSLSAQAREYRYNPAEGRLTNRTAFATDTLSVRVEAYEYFRYRRPNPWGELKHTYVAKLNKAGEFSVPGFKISSRDSEALKIFLMSPDGREFRLWGMYEEYSRAKVQKYLRQVVFIDIPGPGVESVTIQTPDGTSFGNYVRNIIGGTKFDSQQYHWELAVGYHYNRHPLGRFVSDFGNPRCFHYPWDTTYACIANERVNVHKSEWQLHAGLTDAGEPRRTFVQAEKLKPYDDPRSEALLSVTMELNIWNKNTGIREAHFMISPYGRSYESSSSFVVKPAFAHRVFQFLPPEEVEK